MGIKLFGVDIARIVSDAMPTGQMPAATLRKVTQGALTSGQLTGAPEQTETSYTTRGVVTGFVKRPHPDARDVQVGDKEVLLLAEPLAGVEPAKDDYLDVVEVVNGTSTTRTLTIVSILGRDPGQATWTLQCRG